MAAGTGAVNVALIGIPVVAVVAGLLSFWGREPDPKRPTLVVKLADSQSFKLKELWRDAADFETLDGNHHMGIKLTREAAGSGDISVYFAPGVTKLVAHPFTEAIEAIEAYEYPVLAAINGHAIGGGLEVAVTCDLRVAARGVKLGMPPAKIGLIYSHTGLQKFIEVCGVANTNELFLLGRNVDADRGYEMGLVNAVVELDDLEAVALELAAEIGANAPLSLAGNKRAIRALRENSWPLPEELERELVELRESCFFSEDFREGIRAFAEKRRADWKNR